MTVDPVLNFFSLPQPGSFDATLLVLAGASLIEWLLGEVPAKVHPVVWMGKTTDWIFRRAPRQDPRKQLLFGLVAAVCLPTTFAGAAWALLRSVDTVPSVHLLVASLLLSTTFSVRELGRAASRVHTALTAPPQLDHARKSLRALCSRDPSLLDEPQLAAATVESVAENSSDSFVAPLFFYALFGLPGAVFYRTVNTLDAMVGYRGRYEYLGKTAARFDDVLNWIPARLTAGLLLLAGTFHGYPPRSGLRLLLRDGRKTKSPNAGVVMATMAGLLGIELEKVGHYRLGDPRHSITGDHIEESWKIARSCFLLCLLLITLIIGALHLVQF